MARSPRRPVKNRIISWRKIREFVDAHPEDPSAVDAFALWYDIVEKLPLHRFHDIKAVFGNASLVDGLVVFNVGGNKYRLVARVIFGKGRIYVRHVLTHREYDRGEWRE